MSAKAITTLLKDGGLNDYTADIEISNVAPQAALTGDAEVVEGILRKSPLQANSTLPRPTGHRMC